MIDTDWGGTPIEAWSSVDALSQCNKETQVNIARASSDSDDWYVFYHRYVETSLETCSVCACTIVNLLSRHNKRANETFSGPNPSQPTVLWNAMIYPFLNMTIKGAIWYQGESNAGE